MVEGDQGDIDSIATDMPIERVRELYGHLDLTFGVVEGDVVSISGPDLDTVIAALVATDPKLVEA